MRRLPKHTPRGVADIIVVHVGRPYFLEVKRPGSYQSPEQNQFQTRAEKTGAVYDVVRNIEDVSGALPRVIPVDWLVTKWAARW
jgi:hypothetical protein